MRNNQSHIITFIIGQLGGGGSEKQLYLLARELVSREWKVTVININPSSSDEWSQPLELLGIQVFSLFHAKTQIERIITITKILRKVRPVIVHSWSFYTNIYGAFCGFMARIPVRLGSERGNQDLSKRSYGGLKYATNLIGLHRLITNSQIESNLLVKMKPGLKVKVIPNGIDEEELFSRIKARGILGASDGQIVIAGIGSLTSNKNFGYLVDVISKLISRFPLIKLVLIGDGPEKDRLLEKANRLLPDDSFVFIGHFPNAYKLLKGIDILCISSLSEGMPNVVLEASVAGIPIVANKVGEITSLIVNGINGYLADVGDELKYVTYIEQLLRNRILRKTIGESGQKVILDKYSSQKMADNFNSFYTEMIKSQNN